MIQSEQEALYPIGAVASLTGLSPNTIRTWERRHGVASAERTGAGGRRYNEADVQRLQLLRSVTQAGVSISAAAMLDIHELRQTLAQIEETNSQTDSVPRVALLGTGIEERLREHACLTVVGSASSPQALHPSENVDALVIELDCLGDDPEASLESLMNRFNARDAVVLYHFAKRNLVRRLATAAVRLIQEPVSVSELADCVKEQVASQRSHEAVELRPTSAPRRNPLPAYNFSELARIREVNTGINCECPNHLATLINSLLRFEEYSETCINRDAQDAELHQRLSEGTGEARTIMEALLTQVLAHENLEL